MGGPRLSDGAMVVPGDGRPAGVGERGSSAGLRCRMSEIQPASCLCMSCRALFSVAKCGSGCPASSLHSSMPSPQVYSLFRRGQEKEGLMDLVQQHHDRIFNRSTRTRNRGLDADGPATSLSGMIQQASSGQSGIKQLPVAGAHVPKPVESMIADVSFLWRDGRYEPGRMHGHAGLSSRRIRHGGLIRLLVPLPPVIQT